MATLIQYRQAAAKLAGRFMEGTFDSSGGSTTTGVDTQLISSISQDDLHTDKWLFIPAGAAADQVRIVTTYAPSTGTLTVDAVVSSATIYNSKTYELHGFLDPTTGTRGAGVGWTDMINEALKRIMIEEEFTLTPTALQTRHDLTTGQTWLTEPEWVRDVGVLTSSEVRAEVDPYKHRHVRGFPERVNSLVYYVHEPRSFASNETVYVKALKPAYYLCAAAGGAYGTQSGLTLEADIAIPERNLVAWGAIQQALLAYRFAVGRRAREDDDLDTLLEKATMMWSSLLPKHSDLPSDVPVYARALRSFGPRY